MSRSLTATVIATFTAVVVVAALRGPFAANAEAKPQLEVRVYSIADLPIYRKSLVGEYTVDTSAVMHLAASQVGTTYGHLISVDNANRGLMVQATRADHESLQTVLQSMRKPAAQQLDSAR